MKRQLISSGAPWEKKVGYSRALKAGNLIFVSGTSATGEDGEVLHRGDAYGQTLLILQKIGKALQQAGASFQHVTRTRIYTTDISLWEEIGTAHASVFGEIRPATSMVEVRALIHPDMLVEIEADAVLD